MRKKIYIVECFWYRDSEVNVFDTYEEAYAYMTKDFEDMLAAYGYKIADGVIYGTINNDKGEDISDMTYIHDNYAQIDDEYLAYEDKLTWKIYER